MVNSKSQDSFLAERGREYGVHHFMVENSAKLIDVLTDHLKLELSKAQILIWLGSVYINHDRFLGEPDQLLKKGDYLRVHGSARRYVMPIENPSQFLVFENDDFVLINKPPGIPVHALVDNYRENLIYMFKEKCDLDLKVTTRLDIPTSGLIVYAKTLEFQKKYNAYLRDGKIKKIYRAVSENGRADSVFPAHWVHYMEPSLKAPKKISREITVGGLKCELQILKSQTHDQCIEFYIQLLTGRTHQIRSQLSFEGYPILGDLHYGSAYAPPKGQDKIALQSHELSFPGDFKFRLEDFIWQNQFTQQS